MDSIAHLPLSEQQHYIFCDRCSHCCDMRNLNEVLDHLHLSVKIKALWSGSRRKGSAAFHPNRDVGTNPRLHRQIDTAIIRKMNHQLKKIKNH
jgi:hypothetical protein